MVKVCLLLASFGLFLASGLYAFQVFVLLDSNMVIEVEKTDLVDEIRQKIQARLNLTYDNFMLIANGGIMAVGHRADEYNIQEGTTIFMSFTQADEDKKPLEIRRSALNLSGSEPAEP